MKSADKKQYHDIAPVLNEFNDSPVASYYLQSVINRSCPDNFHWTDVENATLLKTQFTDRQMLSLTNDELLSIEHLSNEFNWLEEFIDQDDDNPDLDWN